MVGFACSPQMPLQTAEAVMGPGARAPCCSGGSSLQAPAGGALGAEGASLQAWSFVVTPQAGGRPSFPASGPGSSWGWLLPGLPSAACPGRSPGPGPVRPHTGRGSEGFLALPGGAQQASETAPCPRDLSVCSRRLRAPAVWLPASSTSRCPVGGGPLPTSQDDEAAVERVGDPCSGSDDQAQPIPGPRAPLGSR